MRLVFFGFREFAIPCLVSLTQGEHELTGVVAVMEPRPLTSAANPVCCVAEQFGIPRIYMNNLDSTMSLEMLKAFRGDLGIVIAFGPYVPGPLRKIFTFGCIGIHASLLPNYRGLKPITRAILSGDKKTGVSVFRLTDQMDSGPILVQRETMIRPGETWAELHFRLSRVACDALKESLAMLRKTPGAQRHPSNLISSNLVSCTAMGVGFEL
jgi:methionyl-tRNA formyltransferase